jgi:aspartate kinase
LYLADEINAYRKGLSQIHKSPDDVGKESKARVVDCVFKFGGSSLANAERIDHVAHLIKDQIESGYRPRAVVCSAMGKTTNNLLSAGEFALGT